MANGYQVVLALDAKLQIESIINYWDERGDSNRADNLLDSFLMAMDDIAVMPSRYPPVPAISTGRYTFRRILIKPYRMIYTIDERSMTVTVVDVDHEKRDPQVLIDKFG